MSNLKVKLIDLLHVQPKRHFKYQRPGSGNPVGLGIFKAEEIVIRVDDKHVAGWFEAPLQPCVDVDIFILRVKLHEIGEKQFFG